MKFRIGILFICVMLAVSVTGCGLKRRNLEEKKRDELEDIIDELEDEKEEMEEESEELDELKEDAAKTALPYPLELHFSSGAGAWSSSIVIESDGSFSGNYHDTDMGVVGEEYPNGTVYECNFKGKFKSVRQVNEYTYLFVMDSIRTERKPDEVRVVDGVRYVSTSPAGMMSEEGTKPAKEFWLYTPEAPIEKLSEEFLTWWPRRMEKDELAQLSMYGLCNTETEEGFFAE